MGLPKRMHVSYILYVKPPAPFPSSVTAAAQGFEALKSHGDCRLLLLFFFAGVAVAAFLLCCCVAVLLCCCDDCCYNLFCSCYSCAPRLDVTRRIPIDWGLTVMLSCVMVPVVPPKYT